MALCGQRDVIDRIDAPRPRRHQHYAAAQVDGFLDVMGDEQNGGLLQPVNMPDQVVHHLAGLRIQRAERLVHQQGGGFRHQGPGNGHALLHAAGELAWKGLGEVGQAHQTEQRIGSAGSRFYIAIATHGVRDYLELTAELDVLHHRQPGVEAVVLKDHGAVDSRAVHWLTVEQDFSTAECFQPGDDAQQGGLAAARCADKGDEFVCLDIQADSLQRLDLALLADESLAHLLNADLGVAHACFLHGKARRDSQRKPWSVSRPMMPISRIPAKILSVCM